MASDISECLLSVRGLSKAYGDVQALSDISVEFNRNEIHAVLGENGAGKSTLMGIIGGFVVPDKGELVYKGSALPVGKPFAVRELGIRMVHQHFMLVPQLTVRENFALAQLDGGIKELDADGLAASAVAKGQELGWGVDLNVRAGDLPVGVQQRVEILKALAGEAEVLILDEPTAVLSPDEIVDLFNVLRRLRDQGKAVLLIAHKLSEVMAIADRVTVLRKGQFVATCRIEETDVQQLTEWMVGEIPKIGRNLDVRAGEIVVNATDLMATDDRNISVVNGISFEVRRGEIVGIGGVDGNGQVELAAVLAGIRSFSGTLEIEGETAYIPQDRQEDGLALGMSIEENMLLGGIPNKVRHGPVMLPKLVNDHARRLAAEFDIKLGSTQDRAGSLSGGNQQKIVVARTLSGKPDVIIAVNPTRGLDVKAGSYVHDRLREAVENGAAVVLFSTDLDEISALASRTFFMSRGQFYNQFLGSDP